MKADHFEQQKLLDLAAEDVALTQLAHRGHTLPEVAADVLHRDLSGRVEVAVSRRRTDPWTWHEGSHGVPAGQSAG